MRKAQISCVLFIGGILVSPAAASYDLMLYSTFDAATSTGYVHRVDPVSGAYLGSFAAGNLIRSMAVNKFTNEVYVADNTGVIRGFDYSSGNFTRLITPSLSVSDLAVSNDGKQVFYTSGDTKLRSFTLATSSNAIVYTHTSNMYRLTMTPTNKLAVAADSGALVQLNPSGSNYVFASSTTLFGLPTASQCTQFAISYATGGSTLSFLTYGVGAGYGYAYLDSSYNLNGAGSAISASNFAIVRTVATAHVGYYLVGQDSSSVATRISMLDPYGLPVRSFALPSAYGVATNCAIILAPEPGTYLALGLGIAAIALRRRKQ